MKNEFATLATTVRRLRNLQGISQEELAERCGLHRTYISTIENGGRNATLRCLVRLARGLKTTVSELTSGVGTTSDPSIPKGRRLEPERPSSVGLAAEKRFNSWNSKAA